MSIPHYMKKNILKTCILCLSLFDIDLFSQNEASQWYFGQNAGLNFLTNPPTILINSNLINSDSLNDIIHYKDSYNLATNTKNLFHTTVYYKDSLHVFRSNNITLFIK